MINALLILLASTFAAEPPNVVFILADDLGWMDIAPNNPNTFYETPNLDRLAASGMRFTDAYAASPVCSPTRASIMTGKYPARTDTTEYFCGKRQARLKPAIYNCQLPLEEITIAEALKDAGYATFLNIVSNDLKSTDNGVSITISHECRNFTTKGGSRRLEKSYKVWMMMMMIAAFLTWAGAAEKPEHSKMTFKNHQNDSKQLT